MARNELSSASITEGLGTRFIGQRVIYAPRLKSTMAVARQEAKQGAAEGTVVLAGEQTAGRGRIGRVWLSPRGSVALSIILRPEVIYLPSLIMLASLAVTHSIEAVTGLKPGIKWPNDVLLSGKKVCGILIENEARGKRIDYSIIGIGINANVRPSDFPEISQLATSLSGELGVNVSRLHIVRQLLVDIERLYWTLQTGGSIYEQWRDKLVTLGNQVRVTWGETVYQGIAESVDRDGSLLLRQSDGNLTRIVAGDVMLCH